MKSNSLKALLAANQQIIAPGVFDALSAKIAYQNGCEVLYMSGFSVAASLLAEPDIGLVSATEMVQRLTQVVAAAKGAIVIADGDNGYGGEHNVARLVRTYEQAGAQCIQLEDQVSPKRCGHMENKQVVGIDEAVSKIKMAVSARRSDQFLIMARTDARATHDLDEAIRRGKAFVEAGADILFIEAPRTVEEMVTVAEAFKGLPLVANMVEDGKTPDLSVEELKDLGYQIILRPVSALLVVTKQLQSVYQSLGSDGVLPAVERLSFSEVNQLLGLNDYS